MDGEKQPGKPEEPSNAVEAEVKPASETKEEAKQADQAVKKGEPAPAPAGVLGVRKSGRSIPEKEAQADRQLEHADYRHRPEQMSQKAVADRTLICRQCKREFNFTALEQEFYAQKGFTEPATCPDCRRQRQRTGELRWCSGCGAKLNPDALVYCHKCLEKIRLELELQLRTVSTRCQNLEKAQTDSQAGESRLRESVARLEQAVREKQRESSSLASELEQARQSIQQLQARECELSDSLRDREQTIGRLTAELDNVQAQAADLKLKLELAETKLDRANLAAENEALSALKGTVGLLQQRLCELETRIDGQSRREKTGLTARLGRSLGFGSNGRKQSGQEK